MIVNELLQLIERARAGDRSAYGELVTRFQPAVYGLAMARLRNATEAAELAQEVFVHAMTRLDQLRDPHCFSGWLRQITVRMAINRLTRRFPLQGAEPDFLQSAPGAAQTPLDEMVRAEERSEVMEGLEQLKPIDRDTLVAFYIRGRSLKQMSREFETPVGTIKRRLHVARHRLKEELQRGPSRPRKRHEELAGV